MERGNTKHGPAHDEQLAYETRGIVRGGAERGRTEEWRESEPLEGSFPSPALRPPDQDVVDRSELARLMTRDVFPATRDTLLDKLADTDAPQDLADRIAALAPGRRFGSVHEVLAALGIASPETGAR